MKAQDTQIIMLITVASFLFSPDIQSQSNAYKNHQFDFFRIGSPELYQHQHKTEEITFEGIEIEAWMLTTADWNTNQHGECVSRLSPAQIPPVKNNINEHGLKHEMLLVFAVAFFKIITWIS